jgi:hypothetical protein
MVGSLTTRPNEKMSEALVTPFPVCPSGLRRMALPIAYGVLQGFSFSHLKTRSKSPRAALLTVLYPSSSQVQFTSTLSGLMSARVCTLVQRLSSDGFLGVRPYQCESSLCREALGSPRPLVEESFCVLPRETQDHLGSKRGVCS